VNKPGHPPDVPGFALPSRVPTTIWVCRTGCPPLFWRYRQPGRRLRPAAPARRKEPKKRPAVL